MTLLSLSLSCFPALVVLLALVDGVWICRVPNLINLMSLPLILYGLPLLSYRIHNYFFPLQEGISFLVGSEYSPWWGSYQFQLIYITFPCLESLLRLIPGAFSLWLRLWGSQIGCHVIWTPALQLSDRGLLHVGDRVIFGHDVGLYCHIIKPKRDNLMLYVRSIQIGGDVFVGAGSRLAAGVQIEAGSYLPILTDVYPNQRYQAQEKQ